jgi:hypothetical protein
VPDHVIQDFAPRRRVRSVSDVAQAYGVRFAPFCICMRFCQGAVAIFMEELIEEQLSEMIISEINRDEDTSEAEGSLMPEILRRIAHLV